MKECKLNQNEIQYHLQTTRTQISHTHSKCKGLNIKKEITNFQQKTTRSKKSEISSQIEELAFERKHIIFPKFKSRNSQIIIPIYNQTTSFPKFEK
jgi:hypothetical protein